MYYIAIKNDTDFLVHHGRKGQQWGVVNGPPYPLNTTSKSYRVKQAINNGSKKVKQFMYDRFSEYGKEHQAVRDKLINKYSRMGYNETASQLLAQRDYEKQDKALAVGVAVAGSLLTLGGVGALAYGKIIQNGGTYALHKAINSFVSEKLAEAMSNVNVKDLALSAAAAVKK